MSSTPLISYNRIGKELGINLRVKHDDYYPLSGSGNKARKLNYILNENVRKDYNAIVTAGSNQSNHLRATALWAARLGWKLICIIHDVEPSSYTGNLLITKLCGSELRFVDKSNVKVAMDEAMDDLYKEGLKPFYIWGGGHCLGGTYAYYDAVKELHEQVKNDPPDYIFLASGTGATQGGIEVGIRSLYPDCSVVGISVARNAIKGKTAILQSMEELNDFLHRPINIPDDIIFNDNFIGKGYEAVNSELLETIKWAAKTEGLLLDSTYTGKAFLGLKTLVENGFVKSNSNVVFWHTGGLLNLVSSKYI